MNTKRNIMYFDGVGYEFYSDGFAHIIDYDTYERKILSIPEYIYPYDIPYKVVSIREKAFYNNVYIEGVLIPPSIKHIGSYAFMRSSIQKVVFLDRALTQPLTLEQGCFSECLRLKEVHLPDVLDLIPDFAFHLCYDLKHVHTPKNLKYIGSMAFCECESLQYFNFTPKIESIADAAFMCTNLNYIEIGKNINWIDSLAFSAIEELKTLVIENPSAYLHPGFLKDNKQIIIYINGSQKDNNFLELKKMLGLHHFYVIDPFQLVTFEGIKYLLFSKNVGRIVSYDEDEILSNIIIPEKIKGIPITDYQPRFMKGSQKLISFQFPKSLKRLRGRAFDNCPNLKEVTFLNPVHEKEIKNAVSNERVKIHANNKKEIKEYAILIQKSYVSDYTHNKETEYVIQIFEADSYQDAMFLGLDYCIEHYTDEIEYLMIDDQPQKLMDVNNQSISERGDLLLSNKRKTLTHILFNAKKGTSYTAEVFGKDNSIDFKDFIIQHDKSLNNDEANGSYFDFLKYIKEACHTLYEVRGFNKEIVWSIDSLNQKIKGGKNYG